MMNEDIQEVLLSRQLKIQLNNFDSVFFWSYEKHIQIRVRFHLMKQGRVQEIPPASLFLSP